MADANSLLQIIISLQDNASAALKDFASTSDNMFQGFLDNSKKIGIGMVAVGAAIDGVLGIAIHQAMKDQEVNTSLNATLVAMQKTAQENLANTAQDSEMTSVLTAKKQTLQAEIKKTSDAIEKLSSDHAKNANQIAIDEAHVSTYKNQLEQVNMKLQDHADKLAFAGADLGKFTEQINNASNAAINFGFDNTDVTESINMMIPIFGNVNEAIQMNQTAMDLARAKHISLVEAARMIGLAYEGNGRALKQFGINIKDTATPMEALKQLQDQVRGQSDAFSKTYAGQMEVMKAKQQALMEQIGYQLLPILTELFGYLNKLIGKISEWASAHPALFRNIVLVTGAVGALLVPLGGFLIILPGLIAAIGLVGTALTFLAANPIVLIIGGLILLGVAIYEIIKHWQEFKTLVIKVWEDVTKWISQNWQTIIELLLPGLGHLVVFFASHWGQIKADIELTWTAISDFFAGIWEGIKKIFADAWNWINDNVIKPIMNAVDKVKSAISSVTPQMNQGASLNPFSSSFQLPHLASGGIVTGPTMALVGEAGPEAIIPLSAFNGGGNLAGAGSSGGGGNIIVNINGGTYLSQEASRMMGDMIAKVINRQLKLRTV